MQSGATGRHATLLLLLFLGVGAPHARSQTTLVSTAVGGDANPGFDLELPGRAEALPTIRKGPRLIYPGINTQMKVVWQLSAEDTCAIEWWQDGTQIVDSAETVEYGSIHQHAHVITGLLPATKYHYRVIAGIDSLTGSFWTAPEEDATSVKFIAYGDTRTYPEDHDLVAQGIIDAYRSDPAYQSVIISMGDLVTEGDEEEDWQSEFFNPAYANIQTMLAEVPYHACMGNHERDGVLFKEYFPYPFVSDRYWSFTYGPVHFLVMDQYVNYALGSPQLIWLENELAASTKPWKIVYLHEPGWSAGGHGGNANVQQYIQPLCEAYGVKILLAGHNHYYARCTYNGVQHITTGGGGAPLRTPDPSEPYVQFCAEAHHFCKVEIRGRSLTLTAVRPDGSVLETVRENLLVRVPALDPTVSAATLSMSAPSPNPFRSTTAIPFSLRRAADVILSVYDVRGRRVRLIEAGRLGAGGHEVLWNGKNADDRQAPPGIYFYELRANDETRTGRMLLVK